MDSWIAVDWGTSHLRAWRMAGRDAQARFASDAGMSKLRPEEYPGVLERLVGGIAGPAIVCGMAGAKQGWAEAPYRAVPARPPGISEARRIAEPFPAFILPGMSQATPPDVMRGEETQIAGVLAARPGFDGVICLPGTHTKWVHVSAGEVVSFRTFMSGEIFGLLATQSVLRHSVGEGWDEEAFLAAVSDSLSRPQVLAAELFTLRAASLLAGQGPEVARARLSGLLIGAELAGARPWWLGREVVLVGTGGASGAYRSALGAQGVPVQVEDAEAAVLRGLVAAWEGLGGQA